jgi:hypothetical protein
MFPGDGIVLEVPGDGFYLTDIVEVDYRSGNVTVEVW